MRIRSLLFYLTSFIFFLVLFVDLAIAQSSNICGTNSCTTCTGCGGTQTCTTWGVYTTGVCDDGQCRRMECWDQDKKPVTGGETHDGSTYWAPQGTIGVTCQSFCEDGCRKEESCIQEHYDRPCSLPSCPSGNDPTSTPNPTNNPVNTFLLRGSIQEDIDAVAAGTYCSQASTALLNPSGYKVNVTNTAAPATTYTTSYTSNGWSVSTNTDSSTYTVTLDLSQQTGSTNYVCSCPAPLNPSNPYLCRYTGVSSPRDNIRFYIKEYNLTNDSWFQIFGGNLLGRNSVVGNVPYSFCSSDNGCQPALNVPLAGSSNPLSSGFAFTHADDSNNISSSSKVVGYDHSYLHLANRPNNLNSYAVSADLNQLSYDYFYKLAENSLQKIGNGEDLEPLLSDWTNAPWWVNNDINYVAIDGNVNIDETKGFNLSSNQQLVVFVDGNLILDDSDTNDSNRKITSVAPGGFLAFFVSGDIIITADVGYELNPLVPSTPAVSNANSNLEGVFVANSNLIMQSKNAIGEVPPDRKFIGAGTFVGWNNVLLNRTFNDNNFGPILSNSQAIENFIYRPDLLANWPTKLKASTSNWREVDPQFINQ